MAALKVEIEFPDADISTYNESSFLESLALALNVDVSSIRILDVRAGSIIVDFAILPAADEDTIESELASTLRDRLSGGGD